MGSVYAAQDEVVGRTVALKFIHAEHEATHRLRLVREARALAQLNHPNIVQVYEVGREDDRFFIAMEMVEGVSLERWLDTRRAPSEILDVFIQAARGLAAAHQVGLVHRDFKPANVLVGEDGRARVADFGLVRGTAEEPAPEESEAREALIEVISGSDSTLTGASGSSDGARLTRTGALVGTPAYMAPEQFIGESIGPATDQFSFCISLWEALFRQHPFAERGVDDLALRVMAGDLRSAPRVAGVPRGLESILARGLASRPERRWPDLDALVAAIDRGRSVGKRRFVAAGAGLTLCVASMALVVGSESPCLEGADGVAASWSEARKTQIRDAFEKTRVPYAQASWESISRALDSFAEQWGRSYANVCGNARSRHFDSQMHCLERQRLMLEAKLRVLAEPDAQLLENAAQVAELPSPEVCENDEGVLAAIDPSELETVEEVRSQVALASALGSAGRLESATAMIAEAVERAEAVGFGPVIAEAYLEDGTIATRAGEQERAVASLRQAFEHARASSRDAMAARSAAQLAAVLGIRLARFEESKRWLSWADVFAEREGSDPSVLAYLHYQRGAVARAEGDYEEAREQIEASIVLNEELAGSFSPALATALLELSDILSTEGRHDDALMHLRRAMAIRRKAVGPAHPKVAELLGASGGIHWAMGSYERAQSDLQQALEINEAAMGPDWHGSSWILRNLGLVHCARGESERCEILSRRAIDLLREREHPEYGGMLNNLAIPLMQQEKFEEAERVLREAVGVFERTLGSDSSELGQTLNNLGYLVATRGDFEEAKRLVSRSLEIKQEQHGYDHPVVATSLDNLGSIEFALGHYDRAWSYHLQAVQIMSSRLGDDHPSLLYALYGLGRSAFELGRRDEAQKHLEWAARVMEQSAIKPLDRGAVRFMLARALWGDRQRREQATNEARIALEELRTPNAIAGDLANWARPSEAEIVAWLEERR